MKIIQDSHINDALFHKRFNLYGDNNSEIFTSFFEVDDSVHFYGKKEMNGQKFFELLKKTKIIEILVHDNKIFSFEVSFNTNKSFTGVSVEDSDFVVFSPLFDTTDSIFFVSNYTLDYKNRLIFFHPFTKSFKISSTINKVVYNRVGSDDVSRDVESLFNAENADELSFYYGDMCLNPYGMTRDFSHVVDIVKYRGVSYPAWRIEGIVYDRMPISCIVDINDFYYEFETYYNSWDASEPTGKVFKVERSIEKVVVDNYEQLRFNKNYYNYDYIIGFQNN